MRISDIITEALDSPAYVYSLTRDDSESREYYFTANSGINYVVNIAGRIDHGEYCVDILFGTDKGELSITNTGDARNIFSTVVNIVKKDVIENTPDHISFSADKHELSRVRLYDALVNRLTRVLPNYILTGREVTDLDVIYYLDKKKLKSLKEYDVDNENGLGATGYNANVNYRGIRVLMRPSKFLALAQKLNNPRSVDHIKSHMQSGGSLGSPFLIFDFPEEWEDGNFDKPARIRGHEGRNRMLAIKELEGDDPVEVHLFGNGEVRARHLTPDIIKHLQIGMINQDRDKFIPGPLFTSVI